MSLPILVFLKSGTVLVALNVSHVPVKLTPVHKVTELGAIGGKFEAPVILTVARLSRVEAKLVV